LQLRQLGCHSTCSLVHPPGMSSALGVALVALGGVLSGSFTVPMQFCVDWPWEACW
jgi:hypothetical protein